MHCTECGTALNAGDRFCAKCGTRVGEPAAGAEQMQHRSEGDAAARGGRSGFRAIALMLVAPIVVGLLTAFSRVLDSAVLVVPAVITAGIVFLYGLGDAFKAVFRERGTANRLSGGLALLAVVVAGVFFFFWRNYSPGWV